jgi:hypothetical protein
VVVPDHKTYVEPSENVAIKLNVMGLKGFVEGENTDTFRNVVSIYFDGNA